MKTLGAIKKEKSLHFKINLASWQSYENIAENFCISFTGPPLVVALYRAIVQLSKPGNEH